MTPINISEKEAREYVEARIAIRGDFMVTDEMFRVARLQSIADEMQLRTEHDHINKRVRIYRGEN